MKKNITYLSFIGASVFLVFFCALNTSCRNNTIPATNTEVEPIDNTPLENLPPNIVQLVVENLLHIEFKKEVAEDSIQEHLTSLFPSYYPENHYSDTSTYYWGDVPCIEIEGKDKFNFDILKENASLFDLEGKLELSAVAKTLIDPKLKNPATNTRYKSERTIDLNNVTELLSGGTHNLCLLQMTNFFDEHLPSGTYDLTANLSAKLTQKNTNKVYNFNFDTQKNITLVGHPTLNGYSPIGQLDVSVTTEGPYGSNWIYFDKNDSSTLTRPIKFKNNDHESIRVELKFVEHSTYHNTKGIAIEPDDSFSIKPTSAKPASALPSSLDTNAETEFDPVNNYSYGFELTALAEVELSITALKGLPNSAGNHIVFRFLGRNSGENSLRYQKELRLELVNFDDFDFGN